MQRNLVGAATRYIAGRNAVQTVYWRSQASSNPSSSKFVKVSKTFNFGKSEAFAVPPNHIRQDQKISF